MAAPAPQLPGVESRAKLRAPVKLNTGRRKKRLRLVNRRSRGYVWPMRNLMGSVLALLLVATGLVSWSFALLERVSPWGWVAGSLALTLGFLPATMLSRRRQAWWLRAAVVATAIAVGFLSFLVLAALASWLWIGAARLAGAPVDGRRVAGVCYGAGVLAGLLALVSSYWIRVTRVTVALRGLPDYWEGRILALVTDVHLGTFRGRGFSRRVVSRLAGLGAECVLVGGDVFDGVKIDVDAAVRPWSALSAPSGVFFVGGNHDDYGGRALYFGALRRAGLRILDNERVVIHGLQLVGVHDREIHDPQAYRETLRKTGLRPGTASVLLAHRPSNLQVAEAAGIGLQLSGHTHRGQFWPWTHVASRVFGRFAYGLNRQGAMQVYTSSGVGTWGPPFRLGSRSEVVRIRLERA